MNYNTAYFYTTCCSHSNLVIILPMLGMSNHMYLILVAPAVEGDGECMLMATWHGSQGISIDRPVSDKGL